jgi:hypothetical protein
MPNCVSGAEALDVPNRRPNDLQLRHTTQRAGCSGARGSFWVKTPRPIEEPGTLTRRSKDPRPLRLGVVVSMGTGAEWYIGQVAYIFRL